MPVNDYFTPWGQKRVQDEAAKKALNPFTRLSNVRSEPLAERLKALLTDYDALGPASAEANASYLNRFDAATPALERQTGEDVGYLSTLGNTLAGSLADMRGRRSKAVAGAADMAVRDLNKTLSLGQLAQGGGGRSAGLGSYLLKLGLNNASNIRTKQALDDANQERGDFDFMTKLRTALTGQRQGLTDSLTNRELTRNKGSEDRFGRLTAALAEILRLDAGNTDYGLSAGA